MRLREGRRSWSTPAWPLIIGLLVLSSCSSPPKTPVTPPASSHPPTAPPSSVPTTLPPIPTESGPGGAPVVWIGGTLTRLTVGQLAIKEDIGVTVTLSLLGQDATGFFETSDGTWRQLDAGAKVDTGQPACAEALLGGSNLLAIRVFLGADCGPTP